MQVGDRLGGRWRIVGFAPSRDAIERWRAIDEATAEPVEILSLSAPRAPREARKAFRDLHLGLLDVDEPLVVRPLHVHHDERVTWIVRRPLEDPTLEDVRGPLDPGRVAAIGAALLPAVLAAGGATRGALLPVDLGVDESGHPVLAPRGVPLTRVKRGTTRAVAPEAFDGRAPDGPAGLYGLGILLYRLTTGRDALTGGPGEGAPPPPPSMVRHGTPPALDQAILRLLSPDPASRAGALPLLQEVATRPGDLRSEARPAAISGEVLYTAHPAPGGASAREDRDPSSLVLLPAAELTGLSPAARSTAAGLARAPISVLDALVSSGRPLVLETATSRAAARARARELADATGLPVTHGVRDALPPWLPLAVTGAISLVPLAAAVMFLALGQVPLAVASLVLLAAVLGAGAWTSRRAAGRRALHRAGVEGLVQARGEASARSAGGVLAPVWQRLAELRVQVGRADLPDAAAADLRAALKDLEERLEGLARVSASAQRALQQVDATALRTRLAALDTRAAREEAARAERDRLARTVADLDAVEARKARVAQEAVSIRDALSEIAAVLGQVGGEPDNDALRRLGIVAHQVNHAARQARALRDGPG